MKNKEVSNSKVQRMFENLDQGIMLADKAGVQFKNTVLDELNMDGGAT